MPRSWTEIIYDIAFNAPGDPDLRSKKKELLEALVSEEKDALVVGGKASPVLESVINEYLSSTLTRWGTLLGGLNLAVLAAAVLYIFFILPNEAVDRAEASINQRS